MKKNCFSLVFALCLLPSLAWAQDPMAVPTFQSIGLYWDPPGGDADKSVELSYRREGGSWHAGYPMRFNPIADTDNDIAAYRGSLVHLEPGTRYEIRLDLEGTAETASLFASTWPDPLPEGAVTTFEDSAQTLVLSESGAEGAYRVYDGQGATIDVGTGSDHAIEIDASYVIIRNFTLRGGSHHGIRIYGGHDIVIEDCDFSAWGGPAEQGGFGNNYNAAVFSNEADLARVVVQRCVMHHPNEDANNWEEENCYAPGDCTFHPRGPQAIVLFDSSGNHVFRYNAVYSDADHYYNDILGAGSNGSYAGFPAFDSDIYGNYLANCWDDGIEAEGANRNVRIWGNYVEHCFMAYANAATSIGPLYFWRNVSGECRKNPGGDPGYFMKMGYAGSESWMTGHMYLFHNTILNDGVHGCGGLGGSSRLIHHAVTRNNILHVPSGRSISTNATNTDNDYDFDLYSGEVPAGSEPQGFAGTPDYAAGGFDRGSMSGDFSLADISLGYDSGVALPNFNDGFSGAGPDVGAHEAGTGPMTFGPSAADPCEPADEVCDNQRDDDCDGFTDEGCGLQLAVRQTLVPPTIDGDLAEFASAEPLRIERDGAVMTARLLWDPDNLYLGLGVVDSDIRGHVERGSAGDVWLDDAIELYLDPLGDGGPAFGADDFQFIITARGATFSRPETVFPHAEQVQGTLNDDQPDTGFQIEASLPWDAIAFSPAAGAKLGADLVVDDRDAPDDGTPEGAAYVTTDWAGLDTYAVPERWGTLTLVATDPPDGGSQDGAGEDGGSAADGSGDDAGVDPNDDGGSAQPDGDSAAPPANKDVAGGCSCGAGSTPPANWALMLLWVLLGLRRAGHG